MDEPTYRRSEHFAFPIEPPEQPEIAIKTKLSYKLEKAVPNLFFQILNFPKGRGQGVKPSEIKIDASSDLIIM